jgi:hypothetical protein
MSYCFERGIPHSEFLLWNPEDRAKVLAFAAEQAARCNMCGTAGWEWQDNKFAYTAVEDFCQGCYQKAVQQEGNRTLPGTNIRLVPTTPLLKAKMAIKEKKMRKMRED